MDAKQLILVIDDQEATREFLKTQIDLLGYPCLIADTGPDGLRLAKEKKPSLIICDVLMPEMSGFEVCRQLKSDPETMWVPIVLVTSSTEPLFREEGQKVSASAFYVKPLDMIQLVDVVEKIAKPKSL